MVLVRSETLNAFNGVAVCALDRCLELVDLWELSLDFVGITKSRTLLQLPWAHCLIERYVIAHTLPKHPG